MALRMEHRILNAPKEPKTNMVYRARVASVSIEGSVVVVNYTIYTPKNRKPSFKRKFKPEMPEAQ